MTKCTEYDVNRWPERASVLVPDPQLRDILPGLCYPGHCTTDRNDMADHRRSEADSEPASEAETDSNAK